MKLCPQAERKSLLRKERHLISQKAWQTLREEASKENMRMEKWQEESQSQKMRRDTVNWHLLCQAQTLSIDKPMAAAMSALAPHHQQWGHQLSGPDWGGGKGLQTSLLNYWLPIDSGRGKTFAWLYCLWPHLAARNSVDTTVMQIDGSDHTKHKTRQNVYETKPNSQIWEAGW